jgi:hypothetical protein
VAVLICSWTSDLKSSTFLMICANNFQVHWRWYRSTFWSDLREVPNGFRSSPKRQTLLLQVVFTNRIVFLERLI